MARRTHTLCTFVTERYGGDARRLWTGVDSGTELLARLRELPGYGEEKSRIFVAILAKRMGVAPPGWEAAAGKFADPHPPLRGRHRLARVPGQGPRVEEGTEGRPQGQAGPPPQTLTAGAGAC